jgi:hypothetical protein
MRHVFLFIGAAPNTEWLRACNVETDNKGFVLTGYDAHRSCTERADLHAGNQRAGRVRDRRRAIRLDQARGRRGGRGRGRRCADPQVSGESLSGAPWLCWR